MSKVSEEFKSAINNHLQGLAAKDELFAETLKKPAKNIDDCCTYICNQVQNMGVVGLADAEVFNMAVHYYDENDIEVGKDVGNMRVVVNHVVELSQEDKDKAHQIALDQAVAQSRQQISKKPTKSVQAPTSQPSLF